MEPPKDEKYIVFKREEWDNFLGTLADKLPAGHGVWDPDSVEDAVVIRRQDCFAAPALDAYANAITTSLQLDKACNVHTHPRAQRLQEIADYFHSQAAASWNQARKLPD